MARTSLVVDDKLLDEIEGKLSYGDSKAEYIRQAIRIRLQIDPILDELPEDEQTARRMEFVEAAVKKEVDRIKENPNYDGSHSGPPGE